MFSQTTFYRASIVRELWITLYKYKLWGTLMQFKKLGWMRVLSSVCLEV
jgi:hypothetical protein